MASWTGHPNPQQFGLGTTVKLFPAPKTPWSQTGTPPGSEVTSAAVSSEGALTFTGLTEGSKYLGYAASPDRYLNVYVDVATGASGGVTSVNGKEGVVTLAAADVEAVGTESPTFTGVVTVPTPAEGANTTSAASTKYADRAVGVEKTARESAVSTEKSARESAVSTEKTARESADSTLTTNVATAKTEVGTEKTARESADATEKSARETATAAAQAAAEAASAAHMAVHASVTTNGTTGTVNQLHPVNDTAETRTIKLPTGQIAGSRIAFEKSTSAAHEVEIEGNMRGEAAQTIKLRLSKQTIMFVADASGSWWPIAMYTPLATLTTEYIQRTIFFPPGTVPPNEIIGAWEVHLFGTEKRTIVRARVRTSSGTIKVAITRGEAGATEIAAYKALAAAETQEVVESEQALSDKDRITVTASAGSSAKGLAVDVWEKVEK